MQLSKPSHFDDSHVIYDEQEGDALVVDYDRLITLPGPFASRSEACSAARLFLQEKSDIGSINSRGACWTVKVRECRNPWNLWLGVVRTEQSDSAI